MKDLGSIDKHCKKYLGKIIKRPSRPTQSFTTDSSRKLLG